jgi:hypothetical protein
VDVWVRGEPLDLVVRRCPSHPGTALILLFAAEMSLLFSDKPQTEIPILHVAPILEASLGRVSGDHGNGVQRNESRLCSNPSPSLEG